MRENGVTKLFCAEPISIPPTLRVEYGGGELPAAQLWEVLNTMIMMNSGQIAEVAIKKGLKVEDWGLVDTGDFIEGIFPSTRNGQRVVWNPRVSSRSVRDALHAKYKGDKDTHYENNEVSILPESIDRSFKYLISEIEATELIGTAIEELSSSYYQKLIQTGDLERLRQIALVTLKKAMILRSHDPIEAIGQDRITIWNLYPSVVGLLRNNISLAIPDSIQQISELPTEPTDMEMIEMLDRSAFMYQMELISGRGRPNDTKLLDELNKARKIHQLRESLFHIAATQLVQGLLLTLPSVDGTDSTMHQLLGRGIRPQLGIKTIIKEFESSKEIRKIELLLMNVRRRLKACGTDPLSTYLPRALINEGITTDQLYTLKEISESIPAEECDELTISSVDFLFGSERNSGTITDPYQFLRMVSSRFNRNKEINAIDVNQLAIIYASLIKALNAIGAPLFLGVDNRFHPSMAKVDFVTGIEEERVKAGRLLRPDSKFIKNISTANLEFLDFLNSSDDPDVIDTMNKLNEELKLIKENRSTSIPEVIRDRVRALYSEFLGNRALPKTNIRLLELKTNSRTPQAQHISRRRVLGLISAFISETAYQTKPFDQNLKDWFFSVRNPFILLGLAGYLDIHSLRLFGISHDQGYIEDLSERRKTLRYDSRTHSQSEMPSVGIEGFLDAIYLIWEECQKESRESRTGIEDTSPISIAGLPF